MKFISKTIYILVVIITLCMISNAQTNLLNKYKFSKTNSETAKGSTFYAQKVGSQAIINDSKVDWVRIENPTKDWSFAIPGNYLVYLENKTSSIFFGSKDFYVKISVEKKSKSKDKFKRKFLSVPNSLRKKHDFFEVGNFIGAQYRRTFKNFKSHTRLITFVSENETNSIFVSTVNKNLPVFKNFLGSVMLGDEKLFTTITPKIKVTKTINITTLESNKEIIEAINQENSKQKKPIKMSGDEILSSVDNMDNRNRSLVIIDRPLPKYSKFVGSKYVRGQIKFRVEFLSNGKIGKIKLISSPERKFATAAFRAVRKIKFLPATENGLRVTVARNLTYSYNLTNVYR